MMKILAIGDFHGKFPQKLRNLIKKEKPDLILSTGDFANADKIRKIIFNNWAGKKWYEVIGLKKAAQLEKESYYSGLRILRKLNSLKKKVYFVWGNTDFYKEYTTSEPPFIMPGFYDNKIKKMKNLVLIDKKKRKLNEVEILGHGGYIDVTEFIKSPIDKSKVKQKKRLARYKRDERKLNKLFFETKPKKNFFFLIHYAPYKCLDKVKFKQSPMYGKYVGWEPYNVAIRKFKPSLVICGHMHENQGKCKLGKTIVVNPGAACEGKAAVIDFDEKKKKVLKVRFVR